jgi:hypothetical protein
VRSPHEKAANLRIPGVKTRGHQAFDATAQAAQQAEIAFAQFVTLTPYPGTVNFMRWLIPQALRAKLYCPHPTMSAEEIRRNT